MSEVIEQRVLEMAVISEQAHQASLYQDSYHEADRYKWIESEKKGHDLGDAAIREWFRKFWLKYCRGRRIEHVIGRRLWREFHDEPSPFLLGLMETNDLLFDLILDQVCEGWENLDIINWALTWGLPMARVHQILLELNINCARLDPLHSKQDWL